MFVTFKIKMYEMDSKCSANKFIEDEENAKSTAQSGVPSVHSTAKSGITAAQSNAPSGIIEAQNTDQSGITAAQSTAPSVRSAVSGVEGAQSRKVMMEGEADDEKPYLDLDECLNNLVEFWTSDYGLSIITSALLFLLAVKIAKGCRNIRIPMKYYTPFTN